MTVIVLTNCPAGLRGFLTRWLLEISPGVFIGNPSARVRDALWHEVRQYSGQGRVMRRPNDRSSTPSPATLPRPGCSDAPRFTTDAGFRESTQFP